jgi:hypothetical protein
MCSIGLNMVRAALYSISFLWFKYFKFTKSFSVKMKLRHALYFLLAPVYATIQAVTLG